MSPSDSLAASFSSFHIAQDEPPFIDVSSSDWRSQLQPEARQRIVNRTMGTLRRNSPVAAPEGTTELKKTAVGFEEKIYAAAANHSDYIRKISLKLLSMESKTQRNTPMDPSPGISQNSTNAGVVGEAGNSHGGATSEEPAAAATTKEVA